MPDIFELLEQMDDKLRDQQDAPPRSAKELALMRATKAMNDVVKRRGSWDAARPVVAVALEEAGLSDAAQIAAP